MLDGQILNSVKAIEDIFRVNDSVKSEIVIVKSVLNGLNNDIFKQYLSNIKQVFSVVLGEVDTSNCSSVVQSTDTISCLYNQCVKTSNPLPDLNLYIVADELKASDKKK